MEEKRLQEEGAPPAFDPKARIISIVVLALMLITIWYMLTIVLLTFIIGFVFFRILRFINRRGGRIIAEKIPDWLILLVLYLFFVAVIALVSIRFAPILASQITAIAEIFRNFDIDSLQQSLDARMIEVLSHLDIESYISEAGNILLMGMAWFGSFSVNFALALLLSFLLLLEKDKLRSFGDTLENSRISFLYAYFLNFGSNFARSFAKVMDVQVIIAFINCVLSTIALSIMGFPQVLGLGIMIFTLGLIPVAGVVLSLVPLSIVAFNIGGFTKVLAVLIMIAVIHAIEAYVLNPKLMSSKTALPMSLVFIILLVAEHYMQVWGLLIGVPLFIFLLNIFEVDYAKAFKPERSFLEASRRAIAERKAKRRNRKA
ncbi:MAG: AI-2E family transporter [Clostridiales Family XIII bacterium]|jgi:predicted PurR-regulated permease PerM|nr:AI-2E family transporter [Clostridiales Family XIII bacterium]